MKTVVKIFHFSLFFFCFLAIIILATGCAQIGAPTGGPKDSIPPVLVKAVPELNSVNVTGNKISLTFNEYIDVKDVLVNVLVSPYPKVNPVIDYKLKTVTVKLKDTLLPNTTYSINFGSAIRDNNEGNPFKDFTYVFSTGNTIDSLQLSGNVILAQKGKVDSTLIVLLHRSSDDSSVQKNKPDYITRLNGKGKFIFKNLSAGSYQLYALKDGDGGKTYNSPTEIFAFLNTPVRIPAVDSVPTLYAYQEELDKKSVSIEPTTSDKKLRYTANLTGNMKDLISDLVLNFTKPLKDITTQKIILADTNYKALPYTIIPDSLQKNIAIKSKWLPDAAYKLIIYKDAVTDSANNQLFKTDTISFKTLGEDEYGTLTLRFTNIDIGKHPVLQFFQNEELKKSISIKSTEWNDKLFPPGEYELRILFDENNDGQWTPGSYSKKRQPEKVITLDTKLAIKENWDNEREIRL